MLEFTKMHSLGNDFVMLNDVRRVLDLSTDQIQRIADRHRGIGCDQVIVAQSGQEGVDFFMRVFNADGTEVGQCGNGARCLGRYLVEQGLSERRTISIGTTTTRLELKVGADWQVQVQMNTPAFAPTEVPFDAERDELIHSVDVGGEVVAVAVASVGNPHAVIQVEDLERAPVGRLGPAIETHRRFPEGANVGFLQVFDRDRVALRVWERGVGETQACGSGACAAMAVAHRQGLVGDRVAVELPGGTAVVSWMGRGALYLEGPAITVFQGRIDLESG